MNTLKKSLAIILSVLMVISAMSLTVLAADETDADNVRVLLECQQGLFTDIEENYKKGDIFEVTINWQCDDLLRNGEVYTYLNCTGLKVIAQDVNPKLSGALTNISEEVQQQYNEVSLNFSIVDGCDYRELDYIVKYKVQVLETAESFESLTINYREFFGIPADDFTGEVFYTANGRVSQDNKDLFSATGLLSKPVDDPTYPSSPTTPTDSGSTNPTDSTDSTTPQPTTPSGDDANEVGETILNQKGDEAPEGSEFATLSAKQKKAKKNAITVTWNKVKGAVKYEVYGAKCGSKYKKIKTLKRTTFTQKKLKKGTYYKYIIVAVDKDGKAVSTSKTLHIATAGNKKRANPTGITTAAKKDKVTIKVKKSFKLNAETKKAKKTTVKNHRKIKYEASNTSIVKVSNKGKIKAKKKGTCYVYAYAQNGLYKKIKVTVK